jgi:hypothetical protein
LSRNRHTHHGGLRRPHLLLLPELHLLCLQALLQQLLLRRTLPRHQGHNRAAMLLLLLLQDGSHSVGRQPHLRLLQQLWLSCSCCCCRW